MNRLSCREGPTGLARGPVLGSGGNDTRRSVPDMRLNFMKGYGVGVGNLVFSGQHVDRVVPGPLTSTQVHEMGPCSREALYDGRGWCVMESLAGHDRWSVIRVVLGPE